jgi:hypothetical protein
MQQVDNCFPKMVGDVFPLSENKQWKRLRVKQEPKLHKKTKKIDLMWNWKLSVFHGEL